MTLSKPLPVTFMLSGSIHLGLFALLLVNVSQKVQVPIEVNWVEVPQTQVSVAPVVETPSVAKPVTQIVQPSVPTVSDESKEVKLEEVVDSSGVSGQVTSQQELTAEELYKIEIARALNSKKSYPSMARRLRQQGRVIVQFNVTREGKIIEARVVQSSPFKTLNQSAKDLVNGLKKLNPFPKEIKKATWLFQVPVDYQL